MWKEMYFELVKAVEQALIDPPNYRLILMLGMRKADEIFIAGEETPILKLIIPEKEEGEE